MTTLAIIGGGITGRTLAFTLAKENKNYSRILIFQSDSFSPACSWNSTAIVAPRGVTTGHSHLGDIISASYIQFKEHVLMDRPQGVYPIMQYTGAVTKLGQFKTRYPHGQEVSRIGNISLNEETYIAYEEAYLIDPKEYLDWLLNSALEFGLVEVVNEFVTELNTDDQVMLKTQLGHCFKVDEVVFATGSATRFIKNLTQNKKVQSSKAVQGSYLVFEKDLGEESFSITLEGENLIYHAHSKVVLLGSTTNDSHLMLAPVCELKEIYLSLLSKLSIELPSFELGQMRVGLREKASKREPYLIYEDKISYLGGLYKNGYSVAIKMAKDFASRRDL